MMLPSVYYKAIQLTLALIAILAFLSLGLAAGNWRADLGIGAALAFLVALLFLVGRASFAGLAKSHWRYALAALLFYLVLSYHFSPAAALSAAAFGRIYLPLLVLMAAGRFIGKIERVAFLCLWCSSGFFLLAALGLVRPRPEQLLLSALFLPLVCAALFLPRWSRKAPALLGLPAFAVVISRDYSELMPRLVTLVPHGLPWRPLMGFSPGLSVALGEAGCPLPELMSMAGLGRWALEMGLLGAAVTCFVLGLAMLGAYARGAGRGMPREIGWGLFAGAWLFLAAVLCLPQRPGIAVWSLFYLVLGILGGRGGVCPEIWGRSAKKRKSVLPFWLVPPQGMSASGTGGRAARTALVLFCVFLGLLPQLRRGVALEYLELAGGQKKAETAHRLLSRGNQCDPSAREVKLELAAVLSRLGRYEEGISLYRSECGASEYAARAHDGLGLLYYCRGELERGYWEIYRALMIDRDLADAYLNMGDIFRSRGRFARALGLYRLGLEREPRNARLHFALAESLYNTRRLQEAIGAYSRAGELDPGISAVDYKIGLCHFYLGKGEAAAKSLRKYLHSHPKDRQARSLLGRCDY